MTEKHLILIDASGLAYRAFYAYPASQRADGMPTNAILGFVEILWRMMGRAEADPYTHIAAVFDFPGKTFRHKLYPNYKAGRTKSESIKRQFPLLREACRCLSIEPVEVKGFEADDVIATLATKAMDNGWRSTIVTVDKDMGQLVDDGWIEIVDPVAKKRVLAADVEARWGVPPSFVADVQALAGDSVDGYPGLPGIGAAKAAALVHQYGGIPGILERIKWAGLGQSKPLRAARQHRDDIKTFFKLATLKRDVRLPIALADLAKAPAQRGAILDFLKALEAPARFLAHFQGNTRSAPRVTEAAKDPFAWWKKELSRPGQEIPESPQFGWYRRRMVRGGEYVPVRIWGEKDVDLETGKYTGKLVICCQVNGKDADAMDQWGYVATAPITEAAYDKMMGAPVADPKKPIDWNKVPV